MGFLKGRKEMAFIYKPCIHPQMKAKCCHDLLHKRGFPSSSQRANWGELNHHMAQGNADLAAPSTGTAIKAADGTRAPGFRPITNLEHASGVEEIQRWVSTAGIL